MSKLIFVLIIFMFINIVLSMLPHQTVLAPSDKIYVVIDVLKETGYYKNNIISSVTFMTTKEVSELCEMQDGHFAVGCTQPHWLYPHTFDIYISNEDSDWIATLYHEIAHVECSTEECANLYMNFIR